MKTLTRHAGALQLVFVVAVIGSAVALSIGLRPESGGAPRAAEAAAVEVTVVEPAPEAFRPSLSLNGVVEARTVTRVIPEVAGRVIDVARNFRPGAQVAAGEILFRIDPSDYELAIERTLAEIESARSDLARLEAEAAAERTVWAGQFPERPIPDLIARVPQIAAVKARIRAGEAARRDAELSLERTVVRAPFDARVIDTELGVGQVVGGSAAVGSVYAIDSLEIAVPVSSDELAQIGRAEGRRATIAVPSFAGGRIEGRVVRSGAALDERTRLRTLYIATDAADALTVGEFVAVEIDGGDAQNALRVPASALTSRDQLWVVDGGQLVERRVEVLGRDSGAAIVSRFDTAGGVVSVPPSDARPGLPVTPRGGGRLAGGISSAGK